MRQKSSASRSGDDPNFPHGGLDIQPSYGRYVRSEPRAADDDDNSIEWARDSREDIQRFGIAGRVWEAAYVLQRYLSNPDELEFDPHFCIRSSLLQDEAQSIIELGAGAGVAGIYLAKTLLSAGAAQARSTTVILTDLQNVLPLLERNLERSGLRAMNADVKVRPLPWGSAEHADAIVQEQVRLRAPISHVLCSDLVYFPELLPPLLRTLIHLTSATESNITMSYKIRSLVKEEPFWRAFGVWFEFRPVLCRARTKAKAHEQSDMPEEWRRFGLFKSDSFVTSAEHDREAEDDIFIFHASRKQDTQIFRVPPRDDDLMEGYMRDENDEQISGRGMEQFEMIMLNMVHC